eukprot:TRINITY_DN13259_c0_g2_i1.p2 TRINITY_DN13259_c0_g2~~TRINITY_DN13259_c0_g2_i1.p2  ORF type:complete len:259 (+),score=62.16 TRINITY_DN13259_c0_g2_i1:63-779(+)
MPEILLFLRTETGNEPVELPIDATCKDLWAVADERWGCVARLRYGGEDVPRTDLSLADAGFSNEGCVDVCTRPQLTWVAASERGGVSDDHRSVDMDLCVPQRSYVCAKSEPITRMQATIRVLRPSYGTFAVGLCVADLDVDAAAARDGAQSDEFTGLVWVLWSDGDAACSATGWADYEPSGIGLWNKSGKSIELRCSTAEGTASFSAGDASFSFSVGSAEKVCVLAILYGGAAVALES